MGQTEKDGHSRSTAGQPPTAEMLTDWPAQSVSAVNRHQLVDPKDRKTNLKQSLVAGDCDGKICPLRDFPGRANKRPHQGGELPFPICPAPMCACFESGRSLPEARTPGYPTLRLFQRCRW